MALTPEQKLLCDQDSWDFSDLRAIFINCTLKPTGERSNTEALMDVAREIMEKSGVTVDYVRAVDHDIAPGVYPDMREHGAKSDEWPQIQKQIMAANILVVGTPIWLGDKSSVATRVIERLYSYSGELNDAGQYAYYGRVGGCIVTGNEDGIKHCAMNVLYSLQHIGYTIPPRPMPAGSAQRGQARLMPMRVRAGRKTSSPSATPPSWPGISCIWRG
jgi:multimeric flavodoxin WrbA